MEVFCIVLFFFSCLCNFLLYKELRKLSAAHEISQKLIQESHEVLNELCEDLGRIDDHVVDCNNVLHMLSKDFKQAESPNKPIKPNNWDSVREAFKGPTRVEINERT